MDTPAAAPVEIADLPPTAPEIPPAPETPPAPVPKRGRGRPKGAKTGTGKARSHHKAPAVPVAELDPLADDRRPPPEDEDEPGPDDQGEPAETAPTDGSLGLAGARAMAPAYYGAINTAVALLVAAAPKYKDKPEEAKAAALALALDATGHYDGAELKDASPDRQSIDPPLILVLAKVKLTPEWALAITTIGVLGAKFSALK